MVNKYYIICLEHKSVEGGLLFWRAEGRGYTSSLKDAGLFSKKQADKMNNKGEDIALTMEELKEQFHVRTYIVAYCSLYELKNKKKEMMMVKK